MIRYSQSKGFFKNMDVIPTYVTFTCQCYEKVRLKTTKGKLWKIRWSAIYGRGQKLSVSRHIHQICHLYFYTPMKKFVLYHFLPRIVLLLHPKYQLNRLVQEGPKSIKAKFSGEGKNDFIQKHVNSIQLLCD